jgi:hypothetical protein
MASDKLRNPHRVRKAENLHLAGSGRFNSSLLPSQESPQSVEDLGNERAYRTAPVRGRKLPTALVRSTGLLTHQGTPREEWALLSRLAELATRTAENESDAIRYRNRHTGKEHTIVREPGRFIKSIQGLTEDVRRRVWHRSDTPGDGEMRRRWSDDFGRHYDRTRKALERIESYVRSLGPAVQAEDKMTRDRNGRLWVVADNLTDLPGGSDPPAYVRSSGPEPEINWDRPYIDPLDALERMLAHRESLHSEFTHGMKCARLGSPHKPKQARMSETWTSKNGTSGPRFMSTGRWRKEEVEDREKDRSCTVPWIVADIDGEDWKESEELARRLCKQIEQRAADASDVVVAHTGNRSFHVRIPHGLLGCPVYRDEEAAKQTITGFFDRLCAGDPELREAIDDRCFRPGQLVRMIGSQYERDRSIPDNTAARPFLQSRLSLQARMTWTKAGEEADRALTFLATHRLRWTDIALETTPQLRIRASRSRRPNTRRVVASTIDEFLTHPPGTLRQRSTQGYESFDLPDPSTARFSHNLDRLHAPPPQSQGSDNYSVGKQQKGVVQRVRNGVGKGERNNAALAMALYLDTYADHPWRHLRAWNRKNAPPLPERELKRVYESARRYRRNRTM